MELWVILKISCVSKSFWENKIYIYLKKKPHKMGLFLYNFFDNPELVGV